MAVAQSIRTRLDVALYESLYSSGVQEVEGIGREGRDCASQTNINPNSVKIRVTIARF